MTARRTQFSADRSADKAAGRSSADSQDSRQARSISSHGRVVSFATDSSEQLQAQVVAEAMTGGRQSADDWQAATGWQPEQAESGVRVTARSPSQRTRRSGDQTKDSVSTGQSAHPGRAGRRERRGQPARSAAQSSSPASSGLTTAASTPLLPVTTADSKLLDINARLQERSAARRSRLLRRVLVTIASLLILALVAWTLLFSPLCRVESGTANISGTNRWVSAGQVSALADKQLGRSLFLISSARLRQDIEALPGVKTVTVAKSLPNHLSIQVTPRVPKALIEDKNGTQSVVDEDAHVIATVKEPVAGIPLIQVDDIHQELTGRAVGQALDVLSQVPASLLSSLTRVTAMTQDSVTTQTADGHIIVWGNSAQMDFKVRVVQALLADPATLGTHQSIDVSAPNKPILR